ncbi:MAG TPA: hypothetical protein VGO93_18490 [Candidatus Xenobia bacterium]|jgi:hypothetical protein
MKTALDFLLEKRPPPNMRVVAWCLALLFGLPALLTLALEPRRSNLAEIGSTAQFLAALLLPLLYTTESGFLSQATGSRFLESSLLTGLTAAEWSDGLLRCSLRRVYRLVLALGLGVALIDTPRAVQALVFVPTVLAMMATVAYFYQLRAVLGINRPGREWAGLALGAVAAAGAWALLHAWRDQHLLALPVAAATLLCVRFFIIGRLQNGLVEVPRDRPRARAMRPWSRNVIVIRECWRSARRGGLLAVYLRRFGIFALFTGLMARQVLEVGQGWGPWFIYYDDASNAIVTLLILHAVVGTLVVYWSTLASVFDERRQRTAELLESTPLSATAYRNGWLDWATRYRNLEILAVYAVALMGVLGCWWASTGYNLARWAPGLGSRQLDTATTVVGIGLVAWLWMRLAAHAALEASTVSRSWFGMQAQLLLHVVVLGFVACLTGGLLAALGVPHPWVLAAGLVSLVGERWAAAEAQGSVRDPDGSLKLGREAVA